MKSFVAASLLAVPAVADHWAVIVAGSKGFNNYRHQADACHAYQLFKTKGVAESNIILMMYDDVANGIRNPIKGKMFNRPALDDAGVDVYAGCNIDYRQGEVTPQNFVNVLTGKGDGKVLNSTADDEVFVTFFDHGGVGSICFPGLLPPGLGPMMHKKQLQEALQTMHDQKMYKKLVFYLESCESGSMFEDVSIPGVYAVTAAGPDESSWGTYCGDESTVNGTNLGTCLGDLFSVNWMEDSEAQDTTKETLSMQFQTVHTLTNKSNVSQWSDLSFTGDHVSEYIGIDDGRLLPNEISKERRLASAVSARQVDLHRLYYAYITAETSQARQKMGAEMLEELERQQQAESAYLRFVQLAYPGDLDAQDSAFHSRQKPDNMECELAGHEAFGRFCGDKFDVNSNFALQFHRLVVNVCTDVANGLNLHVPSIVQQACASDASFV